MLLVGAAALALLIVGAVVVYQSRDDGTGRQPVEVAASFLEAYGAFDAEQAITYQADDADITKLIGRLRVTLSRKTPCGDTWCRRARHVRMSI